MGWCFEWLACGKHFDTWAATSRPQSWLAYPIHKQCHIPNVPQVLPPQIMYTVYQLFVGLITISLGPTSEEMMGTNHQNSSRKIRDKKHG